MGSGGAAIIRPPCRIRLHPTVLARRVGGFVFHVPETLPGVGGAGGVCGRRSCWGRGCDGVEGARGGARLEHPGGVNGDDAGGRSRDVVGRWRRQRGPKESLGGGSRGQRSRLRATAACYKGWREKHCGQPGFGGSLSVPRRVEVCSGDEREGLRGQRDSSFCGRLAAVEAMRRWARRVSQRRLQCEKRSAGYTVYMIRLARSSSGIGRRLTGGDWRFVVARQ